MGFYAPPPGASDILGLEVAGEVGGARAAPRFTAGRAGDGARSRRRLRRLLRRARIQRPAGPLGLTAVEAAAIPETYFTVWTNVFDRGALKAGETLLVHGGTSGIGTTAIQLAKAFGATVIATAGSDEKVAECIRLGADVGVNYRTDDFVAANLRGHRREGRRRHSRHGRRRLRRAQLRRRRAGRPDRPDCVPARAESRVDLRPLMQKRLIHTGSTLRPRPPAEKAVIAEALRTRVWPLIEAGRCKPVIDSVFPLADVAKAHARMDGGAHVGKIVLTL